MRLFIDTSGWVGLFDQSDKYHAASAQNWRQFENEKAHLTTTDYVVDETLTHLLYKCGHYQAVRFGNWVQNSVNVNLVTIDAVLWQDAWEMFQAYEDKAWAFTDCTSFVLMRQQRLWRAFSFDEHFVQAGFQLWPGL